MNLNEEIKKLIHKEKVNPNDWKKVHANLLVILRYVIDHCHTHNLPIVISSIIRPKIKDVSQTDIHMDGRAFDISVRGWNMHDIEALRDYINRDLDHLGATSKSDGVRRAAVYEPDEFQVNTKTGAKVQTKWAHMHFQCGRG